MSHKVLSVLWLIATPSSAQLSPQSPALQAPQSLLEPLGMPTLSPFSAALAADITSWGIFVFNTLPSTHTRELNPLPCHRLSEQRTFPSEQLSQFISINLGCAVLSCVQLCTTLWTVACQAPLSMDFSRQEYQSSLPFPPPGDLPDTRIKSVSLAFAELAGGFYHCATWEAPI